MQTLVELLEKSENKITYKFGLDILDGIMVLDLVDINNSRVISLPSDKAVSMGCANRALAKMLRLALKGEFPQKYHYTIG